MAIFKCKMCGGNLEIQEGMSVCECEYCGSTQTVPSLDDEKKINLFTRANRLRSVNEFDKAAGVYESLIADFQDEAEAYWGLILCKYGIEYVDDPKTGKKIPTCNRSAFESVMDDPNFELVMEYSDPSSRAVYREEAKIIEGLRTKIIELSSKEEPYDIFICYKETDAMGERTIDSVMAQEVYENLSEKGYRVFFARISLEDKLGQEYEPYIFSALNSAKIMLVFGTDYEYFNAVWVKNEWRRFLNLIENGNKKTLIPCYKGIDAYDMPKEFARLQAQDMGKVGAIQDLVRGIEKIIGSKVKNESNGYQNDNVLPAINIDGKLNRAFQYVEDGNYYKAQELFDGVLEYDNNCSRAYIGLLLCELELTSESKLKDCDEFIGSFKNFIRAMDTADTAYKQILTEYENESKIRYMSERRWDRNYEHCVKEMEDPDEHTSYSNLAQDFKKILDAVGSWKEADKYYDKCCEILKEQQEQYDAQLKLMTDMNAYAERHIRLKGGDLLGIRDNGTLVVAGKQLSAMANKISGWSKIICADFTENGDLIVALDENGHFISTSATVTHQFQKFKYKDIKAGLDSIIGLRDDGTVFGIIGNQVFEPKEWENVVQIECNGTLVAALNEEGKVYSNSKKINDMIKKRFALSYDYIVCGKDDIYLIDSIGNVFAAVRDKDMEFYKDVKKIRIVKNKLFAITNQNICVSEIPTKYWYGSSGNEWYYDWSEDLVDVGLFNGDLYAIKTSGLLIHSNKKSFKVDGIDYYDFIEVEDDVNNAVLLLTNEEAMIIVLSDGRVISRAKDIDTKTWKLFDDIYLSEDELAEKRNHAAEHGNDMFASDYDLIDTQEIISEIFGIVDKAIEEVKQIATLPASERVQAKNKIEKSRQVIEQVSVASQELVPDIRVQIEGKLAELGKIIDDTDYMISGVAEENVKFCGKCGNQVRIGAKFCTKCGNSLA